MGFDALINTLNNISDKTICILCGNSEEYGFKIYMDNEVSDRLEYSLIKRRK